jgi:hypothetical protein
MKVYSPPTSTLADTSRAAASIVQAARVAANGRAWPTVTANCRSMCCIRGTRSSSMSS